MASFGAFLVAGYWAVLAMLFGFGVASGAASVPSILLSLLLIVLFAWRAFQLWKGDRTAAKKILVLHSAGVVGLAQIFLGGTVLLTILVSIKVAIHAFGAIAAYQAMKNNP